LVQRPERCGAVDRFGFGDFDDILERARVVVTPPA
jgi:hypothetical protein